MTLEEQITAYDAYQAASSKVRGTCKCLGELYANVTPSLLKDARALIGLKVEYLCSRDIDRSGRGYFFPRIGVVTHAEKRNLAIDHDWFALGDLVEMRVIHPTQEKFDVWSLGDQGRRARFARLSDVEEVKRTTQYMMGYMTYLGRVQAPDMRSAIESSAL